MISFHVIRYFGDQFFWQKSHSKVLEPLLPFPSWVFDISVLEYTLKYVQSISKKITLSAFSLEYVCEGCISFHVRFLLKISILTQCVRRKQIQTKVPLTTFNQCFSTPFLGSVLICMREVVDANFWQGGGLRMQIFRKKI